MIKIWEILFRFCSLSYKYFALTWKMQKKNHWKFHVVLNFPSKICLSYCLFQRFWPSDLSLNSEARGGPIFLKFLHIIWHLYTFNFGDWKNFPTAVVFLRAAKRKIEATFHNFFDVVNLYEIFYVMKFIEKIHLGVFVIGNIVYFHFRPILEFSDPRFWRY
jgi:hypothetical protein